MVPPHCTPEALAQALERERQIVITFRPHVSEDPGVYGLLSPQNQDGSPPHYVTVYRQTHSIVLGVRRRQLRRHAPFPWSKTYARCQHAREGLLEVSARRHTAWSHGWRQSVR